MGGHKSQWPRGCHPEHSEGSVFRHFIHPKPIRKPWTRRDRA